MKKDLVIKLTAIFIFIFALHASALADEAYDETEYIPKYRDAYDTSFYQAASVLVMDAYSGLVLYETEGFTRRYPASITKVMTALLVLEHVEDLEERVVFSANAVDIPWYASRMGIYEGESISVREGLYGIMLPSGNEVARALAEHVAGSVPEFVLMINQRAWEMGAYYTRFVNPCGLPGDGQFVTAYDVALIMKEAIRHPIFVDIISTPFFDLPPTEYHEEVRALRNTNRMIRPEEPEYNQYVIGGKTGFTNAAQHTLVTYARNADHALIISVLYAPSRATFSDTAALMDYVFYMLERAAEEAEYEPYTEYEPEPYPEPYEEEYTPAPENQADTETSETLPIDSDTEPYEPEPAEEHPAAYNYTSPTPPRTPEHQEISDTEAIAVASMSIGMVAVSLGVIWLVNKRGKRKLK